MNQEELEMSKMSFINKDFASIYPDLLDLVRILTNRWDPASSNESDPGVVLLKLGAFLADHLNYNIDKNILEAFLPTATQDESVRRLAEFGGYTPKYYRSATGNISVTYQPTTFISGFSIPKFSLVITNEDGSIAYTQVEDLAISKNNIPFQCKFMEGTIQKLSIGTDDVITLNNLDANNRIYFPNRFVAENGIYIYNISGAYQSAEWKKANYIATQPMGTKCYKVDYSSSMGLPYIEFPSDIANLIGDGLKIWYMSTSGSYGNVKAGELNTVASIGTFANELDIDVSSADFKVQNQAVISNGREPESMDEIYRSYKQTVGTFDTLVSCLDYSRAIRNLEHEDGTKFVSNGLLTDRRTEYNRAVNVVSCDDYGLYSENVALDAGDLTFHGVVNCPKDPTTGAYINPTVWDDGTPVKAGDIFSQLRDTGNVTMLYTKNGWQEVDHMDMTEMDDYIAGMKPYDIIIYALQAYAAHEYSSLYYWRAMANSFKQIDGDSNKSNRNKGTEDSIIAALDDYKCINHIFRDLNDGDVYCFKNKVPLQIDITPYNKVTKYERDEIINNIRRAISDNFNASMINFGEELSYDLVKAIIKSADDRIADVNLADFVYTTKVLLKNSANPNLDENEVEVSKVMENSDWCTYFIDMVAKNVISGRLALFNFLDDFVYSYGQSDMKTFNPVSSLSSNAYLRRPRSSGSIMTEEDSEGKWDIPRYGDFKDYNLTYPNTYVEILYPNFYSQDTYGAYVYYKYHGNRTIKANTETTLEGDEWIGLQYVVDDVVRETQLQSGDIVNVSFDLKPNDTTRYKVQNDWYQLGSNETISKRILLQTNLRTPTFCYWYTNNNNILFNDGQTERVLDDGEYFIYTDSSKENISILGRGTKLIYNAKPKDVKATDWTITEGTTNKISPQSLADNGLVSKLNYKFIDFSFNTMSIIEMNIVTLGEGDSFSCLVDGLSSAEWEDGTSEEKYKPNSKVKDFIIDNDLQYIYYEDGAEYGVKYKIGNDVVTLTPQENFYQIRTRLDINCTDNTPQQLYPDQFITINDMNLISGETYVDSSGVINYIPVYLQSNYDVNLIGDKYGISLDDYNVLGSLELGLDLLQMMVYKNEKVVMDYLGMTKTTSEYYIDHLTGPYYIFDSYGVWNLVPLNSEGIYSNIVVDSTYHVDPDKKEQTYYDFLSGDTTVELVTPGKITLPFTVNSLGDRASDSYENKQYISPIYLISDPDFNVNIRYYSLDSEDSESTIPFGAYGLLSNDAVLTSEGFTSASLITNQANFPYPIINFPWDSEGSEGGEETLTVYLEISWDIPPLNRPNILLIKELEVVRGANIATQCSLDELVERINEMIEGSNKENLQFYYTNKPEQQNEINILDMSDPYALFDINNVANPLTISEIDLKNTTIDIVKSMRNYKW